MKNFAIKRMILHTLSVLIVLHTPNMTRFLVNWNLCECETLLLNSVESSCQNVLVLGHSQMRWSMVSLRALQKVQRWHCSCLNLDTYLLVVKILCRILNWSHHNLVSLVEYLTTLKPCIHWDFSMFKMFDHLLYPVIVSSFSNNSL